MELHVVIRHATAHSACSTSRNTTFDHCAYLFGFHSYKMYPLVQITPLTLGFWALAISYPILVYIALYGGLKIGAFGYSDHPDITHSFAPALAPFLA